MVGYILYFKTSCTKNTKRLDDKLCGSNQMDAKKYAT
jgi:hypothetical protein